jgi:DNA-binding LacI/PurR family transcriptional regulator
VSTIQDVARHAAVSVSTVSNVLNGRTEKMRQETLARVEEAIVALKYRPSTLARQLKTGQTPLLGLLVPSIANPMYGYIAREVETFAQEKYGYRVLIGNTYRDREKEASFFEDLLAHGVRHVIVISSLADESHLTRAVQRGMVVVSYDRRSAPGEQSEVNHVAPDNFEAARMATRHLIAHGHAQLAFVTLSGLTVSRSDKIDGFYAAASEAGLRDHACVIEGGPSNEYGDSVIGEVGHQLARQIVKDANRPTGIVAVNDLMALGLISGLRETGLSVPSDVSVVGIDGLFLSALSNPRLTTVQLPVPEMARAMVERALTRQSPSDVHADDQIFGTLSLFERESVAAPPAPTPSRHSRTRKTSK